MPYVSVQTNIPIPKEKEQQLIDALGPGIEVIPGKVRKNLFIQLQGNSRLYFGGRIDEPAAMVTVDLFGRSDGDALNAYTDVVCAALKKELFIEPDHVYISFTECRHWGAGGTAKTAAD